MKVIIVALALVAVVAAAPTLETVAVAAPVLETVAVAAPALETVAAAAPALETVAAAAPALETVAAAVPAEHVEEQQIFLEPAKILRSSFESQPAGGYAFGFDTENGITRDEIAEIKEILDTDNKPLPVLVVRGSWTYYNDKGELETMEYIADENGFRPSGPSIPKPVSPVARR